MPPLTATTAPAAGIGAWRIIVIGLVGIMAVGIGVIAGSFLLTSRVAGAGAAASYVPAEAPFYVELRLQPSTAQDAALREFLGRFPDIDGVDLSRPLYDQLGEAIDAALAEEGELGVSWEADIAPWFDGSVAFALTDLPAAAFAPEPGAATDEVLPGMLAILGVTDADAARTSIDRLLAEGGAPELTESEHRGVTIVTGADEGAYAVTDDAVLVAPTADEIEAALDLAAGDGSLADADHLAELAAELPSDWLALVAFDMTEVMADARAAAGDDPSMAAMWSLIEGQSLRGAMVVTAAGDRIAFDGVSDPPTGPFALENADRGLAAEVPGDALYFADGGNVGAALSAFVTGMKAAAASEPEAAEQIETAEGALGAELEELVAWIDDAALVAGWGADAPWAGAVIVPTDPATAERRLGQLATFAGLAALDPSSGLSVEETEVAGATVTTIRWQDPSADPDMGMDMGVPMLAGVSVEFTVTGERAIIGLGEGFVARVLELEDGASLAAEDRYAAAVDELGGPDNAGTVWLDLAGTRDALLAAMGPMLEMMDPEGSFLDELEPWLAPLDHLAAVTIVEGDLLVQRAALVVE